MEKNLCGFDRHSKECYCLILREKCPDTLCILKGNEIPIDLRNIIVDNTNMNKNRDNDGGYD